MNIILICNCCQHENELLYNMTKPLMWNQIKEIPTVLDNA
jgi:hypothetical protein